MKRIEQLQHLSREHHQSLTLAQKAIKTAKLNNKTDVANLCRTILKDYPDVWMRHFKVEEETIFNLFPKTDDSEIARLCTLLQQEHRIMDGYYEQMKQGDYSILGDFGALLKKHTRMEERELFPLLETVMTEEQLERVMAMSDAAEARSTSKIDAIRQV